MSQYNKMIYNIDFKTIWTNTKITLQIEDDLELYKFQHFVCNKIRDEYQVTPNHQIHLILAGQYNNGYPPEAADYVIFDETNMYKKVKDVFGNLKEVAFYIAFSE